MLRRRICYEVQRKRCGGLSTRYYNQLYKLSQDSAPAARDKFQLQAGTILTRKWHGEIFKVQITEVGVEFNQKIYKSLSAVAKEITGNERSGPIFFGLRKQKEAA